MERTLLIAYDDLSGEVVHPQLRALPASRSAIQVCETGRLRSRPDEDHPPAWRLQSLCHPEYETGPLAL